MLITKSRVRRLERVLNKDKGRECLVLPIMSTFEQKVALRKRAKQEGKSVLGDRVLSLEEAKEKAKLETKI